MRILSKNEEEKLREEIRNDWDWKKYYWFPLMETSRTDVVALKTDKLEETISEEKLKAILKKLGVSLVYNLRELGESEELDIDEMPYLYESESIIVDSRKDWIIYSSHENSVAFGGSQLIQEVKHAIPNWRDLEW